MGGRDRRLSREPTKAAAGGRRELISENVLSDPPHIYHGSHMHTHMLSPQVVPFPLLVFNLHSIDLIYICGFASPVSMLFFILLISQPPRRCMLISLFFK